MIIIIVDDEPIRIQEYHKSMKEHYAGREDVEIHFRERVEHLCELLQQIDATGRSKEVRLVLDIMFGDEGNTDGLLFLLSHEKWAAYLITNDIPIVVLTNKKKHLIAANIFGEQFEYPPGTENIIGYRPDRVEVYQKVETPHEALPLITERLFGKT